MAVAKEQIRQIISENNINSVADIYTLLKDSFKDILQELMEAELDATLGYEKKHKGDLQTNNKRNGHSTKNLKSQYGEFQIDVPRDRNGEFEPKLIPKYQRDISGIEEKVISLYARGMSTGAKGYQIYCKTSSQSSYKKIAAVKDGALTYRANVTTNVKYSFKVRAYGTNKNGKTKYSGFSNVKSKQAIVPAPASVSCRMGEQKITISWSKVEGAAGYVIYRYDHAVKTVKASVLSWGDKDGYSGAGSYWTYEYCVRAYKIVNGKRVYSKKTKTVTI